MEEEKVRWDFRAAVKDPKIYIMLAVFAAWLFYGWYTAHPLVCGHIPGECMRGGVEPL
jgi:hypothetical protein